MRSGLHSESGGFWVDDVDVSVVGSGPNGLSAAVTMARAGLSVRLYELADKVGGGTRTSELTVPGFNHDVCSAVHPMALASPFFKAFGLADRIDFVIPEVSYGHALAPAEAGLAYRSLDETAASLGQDGAAWERLFSPLVREVDAIMDLTTDQLIRFPRHPASAVQFGFRALGHGSPLWNRAFSGRLAAAMLTGVAAHTLGRMPNLASAGAGLMLATLAHAKGWPLPIGGSQRIADCLVDDLVRHGGVVVTGRRVVSLAELPPSRVTLLDTSARAMVQLAGDLLPARYADRVGHFRYGNAASKVDFALSEPVPWLSAELGRTPTVHVGGSRREMAQSEADVARGEYPENPYVLLAQPSEFDPSRAPRGKHVLWTYTHVPTGSGRDMTDAITRRIEQFAPGFRETIIASKATTALELENYNPNYVGGDFGAGRIDLLQLVKRPVLSRSPWRTPVPGLYLCSSSTPPGPGVHGMSGWRAAICALRDHFGVAAPNLQPA
jgi:phytoene dehydrogenase-like protein